MTDHDTKPGARHELTAYLADFGERLERTEGRLGSTSAQTAPTPVRRRRWRRPLVGVAGLAVAGLTAAFVIAPAVTPVDPVAEARAALGDPDDLVHFVFTGNDPENRRSGSPCLHRGPVEVWQATGGSPRWRVRLPGMAKRCGTMAAWDGTPTPGPTEVARDGDTQTTWYPQIRRLEVITEWDEPERGGYPAMLIGAPEPSGTAASSGDPIERLRALLDEGTLREGRRSRIDGREVVHLVGATQTERGGSQTRFDLAVDASTFAPVRFTTRFLSDFTRLNPGVTGTKDGWATWITDFVTYEQRPLTADAARQLSIRPAAAPRTTFRFTQAEFERRARASARR